MPQQHDHPTSSVLLTQLPSLRHSLSHGGPLLAEWWGTCGTGEMGEEHRGAPDVCMTTSGNARTNRQKGGEAGRKAQDSGSSFPSPSGPNTRVWETGAAGSSPFLPYLPEGAMVPEAWTRG